MTEQIQDPKKRAEELLDNLRKGKSTYDSFSLNFRKQYLIADHTMEQWQVHFSFTVPPDLEPSRCKELDIKLMGLHQEASFYKATSEACMQALKKGGETEYRNRFTALVADYNSKHMKLPAASTLESLVKTQIDDVETALVSAEIASQFWKDILDHLQFCRKLLELAMIGSGIQVKMDGLHKGNLYG